jgi:hypothetical protein
MLDALARRVVSWLARHVMPGVIYEVGACGARIAPGKGSANRSHGTVRSRT